MPKLALPALLILCITFQHAFVRAAQEKATTYSNGITFEDRLKDFDPADSATWTQEHVRIVLLRAGLSHLNPVFQLHKITGAVLRGVVQDDSRLEELGVTTPVDRARLRILLMRAELPRTVRHWLPHHVIKALQYCGMKSVLSQFRPLNLTGREFLRVLADTQRLRTLGIDDAAEQRLRDVIEHFDLGLWTEDFQLPIEVLEIATQFLVAVVVFVGGAVLHIAAASRLRPAAFDGPVSAALWGSDAAVSSNIFAAVRVGSVLAAAFITMRVMLALDALWALTVQLLFSQLISAVVCSRLGKLKQHT
eukprot:TRINITY_DN3914_c0_g1_i1.p1 TRINITY_DN3914_c0_g1~~TRINITY_DN3914_c0_g1_i1.p1  ORF type:complete len:306 (-),score=51.48 TRINITY_DN3914_c0_g1_i1:781-1698(-)